MIMNMNIYCIIMNIRRQAYNCTGDVDSVTNNVVINFYLQLRLTASQSSYTR